jgi:alpha-tubulin suppressor-like RCC1 family protein
MKTVTVRAVKSFYILILFGLLGTIGRAQPLPPPDPNVQLCTWSFEDTSWYSDLGYAPVSFTNLNNPPSFDGNALQVDSTNAAWLQYNIVEGDGTTNLTFNQGAIELWVLPDWNSGTGSGDYGRLIDVGAYSTNNPSSWWSLYFSPDGSSVNFSSETNGVFTNYLSCPISWDTNTWHFVALTYNRFRSQLYVDGQLATNGAGVFYLPSADVVSNGFFVGSDNTGSAQSRSLIDDMATYNYAISAYEVTNDYAAGLQIMNGGGFQMGGGGFGDGDPGFPSGGGGGGGGGGSSYTPPDYGTNLWLEVTNIYNSRIFGWIHNSSILVPYGIFSKQSLTDPVWNPEATFYGSGITTNLTPFAMPMLKRGSLFLEARSETAPRIIGAGVSHNVVIRRDGTVWAWGANDNGELGNGNWTDTNALVQVTGLSNIVAVAAPPDGSFNLALDSSGKVWSWGAGGSGQLGRGDGLYEDTNTAALVPGVSNIVAIAGGELHSLALKSDGTVWAWGDDSIYQLGDGTNISRDHPAPVPGLSNVLAIASGADHSFAIRADDTVWGWGYNEDGELGLGNTTDQPHPVLVSGLTNAVALSGGLFHSIALRSDGSVQAWGENYIGEIGDISSLTPVTVPGLSNIVAIACGGYHNLFLNKNGGLFVWGNDFWNQMGDNGTNDSSVPFQLTSVSNVTAIAGGETSSMISTGDGKIYVWGSSGDSAYATPFPMDLYSNYSDDGSGLPDWWELYYFGHLGVATNADADGDGRDNLLEYQEGTNPTNFDTPPPTGLSAVQDTNNYHVTITWTNAIGSVSDYIILRGDFNWDSSSYNFQQIGEVSGGTTSFVDDGSISGGDADSLYDVEAVYSGGSTPPSAQMYVNGATPVTLNYNLPLNAQLVRNENGRWELIFSSIPASAQKIAFYWYFCSYFDDFGNLPDTVDFTSSGEPLTMENDIPVSSITNGVYVLPDALMTDWFPNNNIGKVAMVQAIGTNNEYGALCQAGFQPYDSPVFVDGREHLKQNLLFELRAATISQPNARLTENNVWWDPFYTAIGIPADTNYVESSFFHWSFQFKTYGPDFGGYPYMKMDNIWPFTANYELHGNLYDPGFTGTSFSWQPNAGASFPTDLEFQGTLATVPAAAVLDISDPYWISQSIDIYDTGGVDPATGLPYETENISVSDLAAYTNSGSLYLESGMDNLFGLAFETALVNNGSSIITLPTGDSVTISNVNCFYSQTVDPSLQFTNYYFAPVNTPGTAMPGVYPAQAYPLPSDTGFANTNKTGVMITSVGTPTVIGGWAKFSILNGSSSKFAYLGQYYVTNAFVVTNGIVTTNTTGVVSPYGDFFPTEPGTVAMITMPDIDNGQQGTGMVQVISLALDANHDNAIDTKFNGSDFVSANHPFRFWLNNNYDRADYDADDNTNYEDDVQTANNPETSITEPDCNYSNVLAGLHYRAIPTKRDLEDFARLWVCGVTTNWLAMLPTNSTVTLSWGDVGSPNSGNPTIDLFVAADADGGIGYQTNETIAAQQTNITLCPYIGRLGPGQSIQLSNNWFGGHFIWCGVSNGTGGLTLTIADANSNVLAQTKTYIQLVDIKQMYERWTVGDDSSVAPITTAQLATNDLPSGVSRPFQFANPGNTTTPYILVVHGWNMETWEKDRFAETAFKRLYWQGYQGRFGSFRWPTGNGFGGTAWDIISDSRNFDSSEFNAWASASGLLNKLNDLNLEYPGNVYLVAHSMGNVVAGEALRLAGTNQVVNTYVAAQAAIPAHCYDPTTTTVSLGAFDSGTPNRYANYYTSGAPCYFNGVSGAGAYVNFFNTNDYALSRWLLDQKTKPDHGLFSYPGYQYSVSSLHPSGFYVQYGSGTNDFTNFSFPTDTYTIFAYCDEARSYALGAQGSVSGAFAGNQIELDAAPFNFDTRHLFHSIEFRVDYPQTWFFWNNLLIKMALKGE